MSGSVKPNEQCDVLVIGAGAAGGALAWRLARGGLKVVCLEQGGWVDWENDTPTTKRNWEEIRETTRHPNPNLRGHAWDYPVEDSETDIKPMMWNGVGGSLMHWGAHFPRLRPSDFRVRSLDGVADDWPLDYYELAPYYELNDAMIGVSGLIMWFPLFFTRFMPGWVINIAMIVHSDEALLAAGFIFTFHFFC